MENNKEESEFDKLKELQKIIKRVSQKKIQKKIKCQ